MAHVPCYSLVATVAAVAGLVQELLKVACSNVAVRSRLSNRTVTKIYIIKNK